MPNATDLFVKTLCVMTDQHFLKLRAAADAGSTTSSQEFNPPADSSIFPSADRSSYGVSTQGSGNKRNRKNDDDADVDDILSQSK